MYDSPDGLVRKTHDDDIRKSLKPLGSYKNKLYGMRCLKGPIAEDMDVWGGDKLTANNDMQIGALVQ